MKELLRRVLRMGYLSTDSDKSQSKGRPKSDADVKAVQYICDLHSVRMANAADKLRKARMELAGELYKLRQQLRH